MNSTDDRDTRKTPEPSPRSLDESIELLRAARIELQAAMLAETLEEVRAATGNRAAGKSSNQDPWPH